MPLKYFWAAVAGVMTETRILLSKLISLHTEMLGMKCWKKSSAERETFWKPKGKNSPPALARGVLILENRSFTKGSYSR